MLWLFSITYNFCIKSLQLKLTSQPFENLSKTPISHSSQSNMLLTFKHDLCVLHYDQIGQFIGLKAAF